MKNLILKARMRLLLDIAKNGHYKNRIYLSENIKSFSYENKLRLIEVLINDKIEIISKLIIKESKNLSLPKSIQIQVKEKSEYWILKKIEIEKSKEKLGELFKNSTNRKRKFSKGDTLQNMKNMLKKPMNTGKWI